MPANAFPNLNKAQRTSPNTIREVKAEYSAYLDLKVTDPPPLPTKAGQGAVKAVLWTRQGCVHEVTSAKIPTEALHGPRQSTSQFGVKELLVIHGCWRRERQFPLEVWLLMGCTLPQRCPRLNVHVGSTDWAQRLIKRGGEMGCVGRKEDMLYKDLRDERVDIIKMLKFLYN